MYTSRSANEIEVVLPSAVASPSPTAALGALVLYLAYCCFVARLCSPPYPELLYCFTAALLLCCFTAAQLLLLGSALLTRARARARALSIHIHEYTYTCT